MTTSPYDHEALWLKAKMFLGRAMDTEPDRPFDERALWASLALELLAKAALARTSPLLIASPSEDGRNLLIASGLVQGEAGFKSVTAKTLFERCQHAFKPFRSSEAQKVANARNDYLHGPTPTFTSIPEHAWWPRYWALANSLVVAYESNLEELVGDSRALLVEQHLERNAKNIEEKASNLLEAAKRRLSQHQRGVLPAKEARKWTPGTPRDAGLDYAEPVECPACGAVGTLEGDDVEDVSVTYDHYGDDDYSAIVTATVFSTHFSCAQCGLVLDSPQLIEQVGLPENFDTEGSDYLLARYEADDYGND